MLHGKCVDLKLDKQGTDRKSERQQSTNLVFMRPRFWQGAKKLYKLCLIELINWWNKQPAPKINLFKQLLKLKMQFTYLLMIILQFQLRKSVEHGGLIKINSKISHDRYYLATTTKNLHTTYQLLRRHRFQNHAGRKKRVCFQRFQLFVRLTAWVVLVSVHHQFFYCHF